VGHSLTLLAAALLTGQTVDSNGRTCPCNKAVQGTISAQPEYTSETRWTSWRNSSSSTTTTQTWRSTSEPSRGPLSRIRNIFGRGDNATVKTETIQPSSNGGTVVVQPASQAADVYRRLPTSSEPPLGNAPVNTPKRVEPASQKPAQFAPPTEKPLTIEVEPIEFRPAGTMKDAHTAQVIPIATNAIPSNRTNAISPRFVNKVGQPGDYSWITGQLEVRGGQYILHYATPDTVDRHGGSIVLATDASMSSLRNGDLVSVHGSVVQNGRSTIYRAQSVDLVER